MHRFDSPRRALLLLPPLTLAFACGSTEGDDEGATPGPGVFQGPLPGGQQSAPGASGAPSAGPGASGAPPQQLSAGAAGPAEQPSGAAAPDSEGPSPAGGVAGAAMVGMDEMDEEGAEARPGAGGAGMMGSAGASSMGAAGSAAMPDPPAADPADFPGTGCGPAAFFCEDFEQLALGAAQASGGWRPEGNVSVDGQAGQGQRSLRLQPAGGQFARIVIDGFAPPQNSFFGRLRVNVAQYPTAPNYAHYVLVEATGGGSSERVRPVGGQLINEAGNLNMWGPGSDGGPTGDWTNWQPTSPTRDGVWECVEFRLDDASSRIDIWVDEEPQPDLTSTGNPNNPGAPFVFPEFNAIWFGWWVFQGGTQPGQFDVRLDDIVLSTERIGCD